METSNRALTLFQQALATTRDATRVVDNLIVEHDYQDVASLVSQAAAALLEAGVLLMQSKGEEAFAAMERSEDLLDAVYKIIDGELDDE